MRSARNDADPRAGDMTGRSLLWSNWMAHLVTSVVCQGRPFLGVV